MKLMDLDPQFLKIVSLNTFQWFEVTMKEADGISFLCPKCFVANGGPRGTHTIICWAPHVPETMEPGPGRWNIVGTSFDDLSLVAGSSSVRLDSGCMAHFFVKNGEIT